MSWRGGKGQTQATESPDISKKGAYMALRGSRMKDKMIEGRGEKIARNGKKAQWEKKRRLKNPFY